MDTPDPILNTRCGSPRQLADSPAHSVDMSETAVQPCPSVIAEGSPVEVGDGMDCDLLPFEVLMCLQISGIGSYQIFPGEHSGNKVHGTRGPHVSTLLSMVDHLIHASSAKGMWDHGKRDGSEPATTPSMPQRHFDCRPFFICQHHGGCHRQMDGPGGEVQGMVTV